MRGQEHSQGQECYGVPLIQPPDTLKTQGGNL